MTSKILPSSITSYDLLKTFAVVIMVVDHVGAYFFPDQLWWRSIGRIGFPVWFFLVGHASGRDLPLKLIIGAFLLMLGNFMAGMPIFPLNALVTIGVIRLLIDPVMERGLSAQKHLWGIAAMLMFLTLPSGLFTEYGTMALITAMFGYMVRHRDKINDDVLIFRFMVFALVTFIILQQITFGFTPSQFLFMAIGTAMVRLGLYYFQPQTFPKLTDILGGAATYVIQLCGRKTLEIYVVHLLAFKALAVFLGLEGYNALVF